MRLVSACVQTIAHAKIYDVLGVLASSSVVSEELVGHLVQALCQDVDFRAQARRELDYDPSVRFMIFHGEKSEQLRVIVAKQLQAFEPLEDSNSAGEKL